MNFQFYVEKLKAFVDYQNFVKEYKDAYPCSCFFSIDKEGKDNKQHFDFYTKEQGIVSCQLEEGGKVYNVEVHDEKIPDKIDLNLEFDFNDFDKMIEDRMQKEGIKNKVQKYLFSLQKTDEGHVLIGTVFISSLGLLKVGINLEKKEIFSFEKKSFFDVMKVRKSKKD